MAGQFPTFAGLLGISLRRESLAAAQPMPRHYCTACDTQWPHAQRLRQMTLALPGGQTGSFALTRALSLYLNFINLLLFMLRSMGSRRD